MLFVLMLIKSIKTHKGFSSDPSNLKAHTNHSFSTGDIKIQQQSIQLLVTDCTKMISESTVTVECPNVVATKVPSIDFVVVVDRSTTKNHVINNNLIDKIPSTLTHNCTTKSPKILTTKENNLLGLPTTSNASTGETSESDNLSIYEGSLESLDVKMWHKSDPSDSVPVSYASSLSLDCQTDEVAIEFMRRFVSILFSDSISITLELKSQFGQYSRVSFILMLTQ